MKNGTLKELKCDCVHCDQCIPKLLKDEGRTCKLLPNGQFGEESVCDMYEIICALDEKSKGYVFSPYEDLEPDVCPMQSPKKKTSLFRKIFQSFF